ncbi:hypothetical protein E4U25_008321 [Claviceps purpurea]|nr:hypothetical protein E4U25_008321 [Claviceps purpurea]
MSATLGPTACIFKMAMAVHVDDHRLPVTSEVDVSIAESLDGVRASRGDCTSPMGRSDAVSEKAFAASVNGYTN